MAKTYNGPLTRHTDFGGDESTGGLPASGKAVQEYIKGIDAGKIGTGYYDATNNIHLLFADEKDRDAYIDDPTRIDLVKYSYAAEFPYTAGITLQSQLFNAVFLGTTGNWLDFTFDIVNKAGQSTGEPVICTYTIAKGSVKQTVKEVYRPGASVHFNIDDYLTEGTNLITIGIIGQNTKAATTLGVTYQVINLSLEDTYDIAEVHTVRDGTDTSVAVPYKVSGPGTKTMEWYLDGVKLEFNRTEDEIVTTSSGRTKYILLNNLSQGAHSLQFRVGVVINGETFYSDTHYREVIVSRGIKDAPVIAIAGTIPTAHGILAAGESFAIYDMVQYEPYALTLAVYNPTSAASTTATVSLGGTQVASVDVVNGTAVTVRMTSSASGNLTVLVSAGGTERSITASVEGTSMTIEEITDSLELDFRALGRTNTSTDRATWTDGQHNATFNDFAWTKTSGWNDGRLVIPAGASLAFDYAPLGVDPASLGKTVELEFSTFNVSDDDAVICDLTDSDGTGIILTATEVRVKSKGNVQLARSYKTGENVRIAVVINRRSGSTNKGLVFFYFNGIITAAVNFAETDLFTASKLMTIGSTAAGMSLKQIRIYNAALSPDGILNNFILYRDTVDEMSEVYQRNDLYQEGSTAFDLDKLAGHLPVMLITGNIPAIEGTTDKKLQITADVEYTNLQDTSRSFKIKGAIMTGQGTSSMTYPKKNFRLYTRKADTTVLYDADGNEVADRLYSFREKAQPVDCWCLKADFAESSGTHNTGVARLWNDILFNTVVDGENRLRSSAQQAAVENGYPYDVRTTVDGFPILVFYRLTETDAPIFIGKYNFNNDKSTESVFGFRDIPGFDASKVQCFEFLDSANPIALFTDVSGFDAGWDKAFESRYPDTSTPDTSALKSLAVWLNSTKDDLAKWKSEKAAHFDLYKLAAYYVYLMRFGAVDQTVKNAMLTTEDGEHWFFINYDNDTILGVRNDGNLVYGPEIDRQSWDAEFGAYAYAGHSSVLWNNFEADEECMALARKVDAAMYSYGLTYDNVIEMFNVKQAAKWSEAIYNRDAQYKYIDTFTEQGLNYLSALQGSRSDHRKWWLSNRFNTYDAQWVDGDYTGRRVTFVATAEAGKEITIVSGKKSMYGFGLNQYPLETGVELDINASHTFVLPQDINLGSPVAIYSPHTLKSLDLSDFIDCIGNNFNMAAVRDDALGSHLVKLVLGVDVATDGRRNNALREISGLAGAENLEVLDISGYKAITALDISGLYNLMTFKAKESGLTTISPADGAPLTTLELPSSVQHIILRNLTVLRSSGLTVEDGGKGVYEISVRGCRNFANGIDWLLAWYRAKETQDSGCSVEMDNIAWTGIDADDLIELGQLNVNGGSLVLKGTIRLIETSQEQATALVEAFGDECFTAGGELFISAPDAVYLIGPSEVLEGEDAQFTATVFSEHKGKVTYSIVSGNRSGASIDADTGLLTTTENGFSTATLTIRVIHRPTQGMPVYRDTNVTILQRIYPRDSDVTLEGAAKIEESETYKAAIPKECTGNMEYGWALSGDITSYAEITAQNGPSCTVKATGVPDAAVSGTLTLTVKKVVNGATICTKSLAVVVQNANIAITKTANPYFMALMYSKGLAANENYMTKAEAASVSHVDLQPGTSTSTSIFHADSNFLTRCTSIEELEYFTGLTIIPEYLFYQCRKITKAKLPDTVKRISRSAFFACDSLTELEIPESVTDIEDDAFRSCSHLVTLTGGNGVTSVKPNAFGNCFSLVTITSTAFGIVKAMILNSWNRYTYGYKMYQNGTEVPVTTVDNGQIFAFPYGHDFYIYPPDGGLFADGASCLVVPYTIPQTTVHEVDISIATITVEVDSDQSEAKATVAYIDMDGKERTSVCNAGDTLHLPVQADTVVMVTGNEIEGFYVPEVTLTANTRLLSARLNYVTAAGVYILHTSGSLYTGDQWSASGLDKSTAVGVAVVTPGNHRFVIHPTEWTKSMVSSGVTVDPDRATYDSSTLAKTDFAGSDNTTAIINSYGEGNAPAAETARAAVFANGSAGYLPACGEMYIIIQNLFAINILMRLIGGTSVSVSSNNVYATSTQGGSTFFGVSYNSSERYSYFIRYPATYTYKVRSVAAF